MDGNTDAALTGSAENKAELKPTDYDTTDAELIDDLVEQEAKPPTPDEMPKAEPATTPVTVPSMGNRSLITRTINMAADWDAYRLMVSDDERYEIHLYAVSETDTDYVYFADDSANFVGETATGVLMSGQEIVLSNYQGPIWLKTPSGITGPIRVTAVAVTSK